MVLRFRSRWQDGEQGADPAHAVQEPTKLGPEINRTGTGYGRRNGPGRSAMAGSVSSDRPEIEL